MSVQDEAQDEIDKIMNEIDQLQKDMESLDAAPTPNAPMSAMSDEEVMKEFRSMGAGDDSPSMEETLADLKDTEPAGPSLLDEPVAVEATEAEHAEVENSDKGEVMSDYDQEVGAEGALSMTLTGSMTLSLKYDFDGEVVIVGFKNHMLEVKLSDGTEFKIPVRRQPLRRVA